ncbi:DUF6932 family protein [Mycolicibacterium pulveris]|uniref:DUF6932 family protein n=1 Tax=Mycolicibacterium pulveris TaxID=36813 RepID=UPI003CF82A23
MIPELSGGHVPPGRYRASLEEVRDRFVAHPDFVESASRPGLFAGLIRYLVAWEQVQETTQADDRLLKAIWIAGSFASAEMNPGDVDLTVIVNGPVADSVAGQQGSGGIRKLTRHRGSVKAKYNVEVFPVRWHPIEHPFDNSVDLDGDLAAYLSDRGKMDDWWQRCRVDGRDVPTIESCETRRGYLEVIP